MKEALQKIRFHYLYSPFYFRRRNALKSFIGKQLKKEGKDVEAINFIFCDDEYLLQINKQYLDHDTFTDIITFELSQKGMPLLSDIYISIERVKENASLFRVPFQLELHRVIFHGVLHLLGYKDKTKEQSLAMREKENELLKAYGFTWNTAEE